MCAHEVVQQATGPSGRPDSVKMAPHDDADSNGCFTLAKRRGKYAFGLLLLLLVVIIWVGSSELMKYIYSDGSASGSFAKPFYLTYFNTAMFSVYLLGFFRQSWRDQIPTRNQFREYISEHVCSCFKSSRAHNSTASSSDNIHLMQDEDRDIDVEDELLTASPDTESSVNFNSIACATDEIKGETSLVPMTFMETLHTAVIFCLLWFAANYTFNLSINLTSVAAVTIISSTSGFFTMMFEQMLPRTDSDSSGFSVFKGLLILMSVCGVGFVSLSDTHKSEDMGGQRKLQGDVIALISAAFYGAYLVFLEKKIGNEERCNMMMFFGFVGLCNIVLLSPVCIVMQILSSEAFVWPAARPFMYLCLNAIVGTVLSDYLWIYSTLLTSPLVATLGLSLTIPTAVMVDYLWGNVEIDSGFMLGMGLVLIAFVGINLASYMPLLKWLYEWVRSCAGVKVAYILLGYKPDASENMPTIHEV